jgi:hypothetical protein
LLQQSETLIKQISENIHFLKLSLHSVRLVGRHRLSFGTQDQHLLSTANLRRKAPSTTPRGNLISHLFLNVGTNTSTPNDLYRRRAVSPLKIIITVKIFAGNVARRDFLIPALKG